MAVDYEALAKKHGGQSEAAPVAKPTATPDYEALAAQAGGTLQGEIPQRRGMDLVNQYLGVINEAIAPYVAAATTGAVAGAPFAGVGAVPGAVGGAGALGLTDLAATLYNVGAQALGAESRVPLASEVIRTQMREAAPQAFREPETPAQRLTSVGAEAATSGLTQANFLRELARRTGPGATRNVLQAMGEAPAAQVAASTGGALTQQAAIETSAPESAQRNPLLLAVLGTIGGAAAGRTAIRGPQIARELLGDRGPQIVRDFVGKGTPSEQQLYTTAKNEYKNAENAGVIFTPSAYDRMLDTLRARLTDEGFTDQPALVATLNKLEKFRGKARSFTDLDTARSDITKNLIKSSDDNVRRLGREAADHIDEFILGAQPTEIIAGNIPQAVSSLGKARDLWKQVSRSEEMTELLRRANLSDQPLDTAIRNEFRSLAMNQKRLNRFSPAEQDFIMNVVQGGRLDKALTNFSEALRVERSLGGTLYAGAGGLATPLAAPIGQIDPFTAATIMTGVAGARGGTAYVANLLAAQRAKTAAAAMRGFRRQPLAPLALPVGQNALRPGVDFLQQSEILNALSGGQ